MIILDTNVISEVMRPEPNPRVLTWLDAQPIHRLFTTAISAAELRLGVARLPLGARRRELDGLVELAILRFQERVLPFDRAASTHYARIVSERSRRGLPIATADAQIAAITSTMAEATLATRNTADFVETGVQLHDPWAGTAS